MLTVLLVTHKRALTKKWLKKDSSTINEWIDLVYSIYKIERIMYKLRSKFDILE